MFVVLIECRHAKLTDRFTYDYLVQGSLDVLKTRRRLYEQLASFQF